MANELESHPASLVPFINVVRLVRLALNFLISYHPPSSNSHTSDSSSTILWSNFASWTIDSSFDGVLLSDRGKKTVEILYLTDYPALSGIRSPGEPVH